jgi:hypothetical protein
MRCMLLAEGGCATIFSYSEGAYTASMTIDVCKILNNGVYFVVCKV